MRDINETHEKQVVGRITFGQLGDDAVARYGINGGLRANVNSNGTIDWERTLERWSAKRAHEGNEQRGEHVASGGVSQRQGPAQVSDQEELLNVGLPHGDPVGELHMFLTPTLVPVTQQQLDSWAIPTAAEAHGDI